MTFRVVILLFNCILFQCLRLLSSVQFTMSVRRKRYRSELNLTMMQSAKMNSQPQNISLIDDDEILPPSKSQKPQYSPFPSLTSVSPVRSSSKTPTPLLQQFTTVRKRKRLQVIDLDWDEKTPDTCDTPSAKRVHSEERLLHIQVSRSSPNFRDECNSASSTSLQNSFEQNFHLNPNELLKSAHEHRLKRKDAMMKSLNNTFNSPLPFSSSNSSFSRPKSLRQKSSSINATTIPLLPSSKCGILHSHTHTPTWDQITAK